MSSRTAVWPAILAATAGTFTVVTSEMLPIGLLTPLAADLDVSEGTAGLTMTVPGLVAAVAAPIITRVIGRLDRRHVLMGLMVLLAAANFVSAAASNFPVLLASRVLIGVGIGGVWAISLTVAGRLATGKIAARANATVMSGIAIASVAGVPLGTWIGGLAGWRAAFAGGGALALLVAAVMAAVLPSLPSEGRGGARVGSATGLRVGLVVLAALVAGHFAAYTYVRPLLEQVGGLTPGAISALLLVYGVAGVAGNFLVGIRAPKAPAATLLAIAASLATVLAVVPLLVRGPAGATALLIAWGVAYGGVSVGTQVWLFSKAPDAREKVSAMVTSVFNLAIGGGALLGGLAADASGVRAAVWLGAGLVLISLVTAVRAETRRPSRAVGMPAAHRDEPDPALR
ncbi:MFS transporter [Phytomonospora sp. NPDC050363]|uniref:MFS transporter n=1 Tax=Phytomonospora sp. NPDC050363 TaxID=3155642 RepID=UPI00340C07AC